MRSKNCGEIKLQLMEQNDLENYDDLLDSDISALNDFSDFGDMTSHQTALNFDDYVEDWLQQYLI